MLVCVEVKSGALTPAESAVVTVNTLPGTATGKISSAQYVYIALHTAIM